MKNPIIETPPGKVEWTYERFIATGDLAGCHLPEDAIAKLRTIAEKRGHLKAARATREAAAALPPSPAQLLADAEALLAREQRDEADESAWSAALQKYGKGRVGRIRTLDGAIVLRATTAIEYDETGRRVSAFDDAARRSAVVKEAAIDGAVHPSKDVLRAILDKYPALWNRMYELRDALMEGVENELLGKA